MRTLHTGLAIVLLAGSLLLPAAGQAPETPRPQAVTPQLHGMVIRDPYYDFGTNPAAPDKPNTAFQDRMGAVLAEAGVRWVRLEFLADPGGQVNLAKYDYFIGTVAPRHGFQVLGLLATNIIPNDPVTLNVEPATSTHPLYGGGVNAYMVAWLDEALRIAAHYDGSSPTAGRVHAFEIFNEANRFFGDGTNLPPGLAYAGIDPALLARLHTKFYRVCKNTDGSQGALTRCPADTRIVLGGLHPKGTSLPRQPGQPEVAAFSDQTYLKRMYQTAFTEFRDNPDNKPPWSQAWPLDAVGYHPYPEEIRLTLPVQPADAQVDLGLTRMRTTLVEVGDPERPFWITEIGYNVGFDVDGPANPIPPQTEQGQAAFMRDVFTSLAARRTPNGAPEVESIFWFKYEDFPPATGPQAQRWGIVRIPFTADSRCPGGACYAVDGQPSLYRPSFFAYRELAGLPLPRTFLPLGGR